MLIKVNLYIEMAILQRKKASKSPIPVTDDFPRVQHLRRARKHVTLAVQPKNCFGSRQCSWRRLFKSSPALAEAVSESAYIFDGGCVASAGTDSESAAVLPPPGGSRAAACFDQTVTKTIFGEGPLT